MGLDGVKEVKGQGQHQDIDGGQPVEQGRELEGDGQSDGHDQGQSVGEEDDPFGDDVRQHQVGFPVEHPDQEQGEAEKAEGGHRG